MTGEARSLRTARIALLAMCVAVVAVAWTRHAPLPQTNSSAPGSFDATRALKHLESLAVDGAPRDPGSSGHARAATLLREEIARLGLDALSQRFVSRGWKRSAVEMGNLLVVVPNAAGSTEGELVLLNAHYDGVPMGPGAGDNAVGVACALEIARVLQQSPCDRAVLVLFSDGEELGLLGAREFVKENPLWKRVVGVVNLDARGSNGPVYVFETGARDSWHAELLSRAPITSRTTSLAAEAYARMPNGTDFSVFRAVGTRGFNLAFIGSPENYHTADDTVSNVDPNTLAQMGTDALTLVRALAAAPDPRATTAQGAIWFDAFGWFVCWWPDWVSHALVACSVLLLSFAFWRLRALGLASLGGVVLATIAACAALGAAIGAGIGGTLAVRALHPDHWPWPTYLWGCDLALLAIGFTLTSVPLAWLSRRRRARRTAILVAWDDAIAAWTLLAAIAVTIAILAPGASHPVLLPLMAASLAGALVAGLRRSRATPAWAAFACAMLFMISWAPLEWAFVDAFGLSFGAFTTLRGALLALACRGIVR